MDLDLPSSELRCYGVMQVGDANTPLRFWLQYKEKCPNAWGEIIEVLRECSQMTLRGRDAPEYRWRFLQIRLFCPKADAISSEADFPSRFPFCISGRFQNGRGDFHIEKVYFLEENEESKSWEVRALTPLTNQWVDEVEYGLENVCADLSTFLRAFELLSYGRVQAREICEKTRIFKDPVWGTDIETMIKKLVELK